ncbi:MAG: ECF transporter S component [Clostridiales bacterium]|jgi:riboflavin transporter FmnP|nr:ECF transporter S component [Clostridiales bacterium]
MRLSTKQLVTLAMLAAVSLLLVTLPFLRFPIIPLVSFLEYDMADIPILIGTFLFGPLSGLILTAVVSMVQGLTVSSANGWVGIVMHFCATGAFVLVAGHIYKRKRTLTGAIIALLAGIFTMVLAMIPLNLIFTPIYLELFVGLPKDIAHQTVRKLLLPGIIPFNLIKAGVNGLVTFLLYKRLGKLLRLERN